MKCTNIKDTRDTSLPPLRVQSAYLTWWLGGLLVERRTSVSQIRGSIPGQVAAM